MPKRSEHQQSPANSDIPSGSHEFQEVSAVNVLRWLLIGIVICFSISTFAQVKKASNPKPASKPAQKKAPQQPAPEKENKEAPPEPMSSGPSDGLKLRLIGRALI